MHIRPASTDDWPLIWPIFEHITRAGETYPYDYDMPEDAARAMWLADPPDHAVVAVDDLGSVAGTAKMGPNKGGGGAHVATASFMVDPGGFGRGVGRLMGEYALDWARRSGYRAMQFNSVVESNTRAVALWESLGFEILCTVPEGFRLPNGEYVGFHIMYQKL
jgi:L-amino acid N-acyltransferase YncA